MSETVKLFDTLIRSGKGAEVRQELLTLIPRKVPEGERAEYAWLACRVDLPERCLLLLHPVLYPPKGTPSRATTAEKAEYAMGLMKIGAVAESCRLLEKLDASSYPRIYFYLAHASIMQWDYAVAIPLLEKAIRMADADPYQALVYRVNLSAALVHECRHEKAIELLTELDKETANRYPLLHGNILKYSAELKIGMGEYQSARDLIGKSEDLLKSVGGRNSFYVRKWQTILDFLENTHSKKSLSQLQGLQSEAAKSSHWETVRDCDFYRAIHTHDTEVFLHLYFGTPFFRYQERLVKAWGSHLQIPDSYAWHLGGGKTSFSSKILLGEKTPSGTRLKQGRILHRLLCALAGDFYRPFRLASLHSAVWPEEKFNPFSSPKKVHYWIETLREWMGKNSLPLKVLEKSRTYSIKANEKFALEVPRKEEVRLSPAEFSLRKLQEGFKGQFSRSEALKFLGTSKNSAFRILAEGVERGWLTRTGNGPACRYHFKIDKAFEKKAA